MKHKKAALLFAPILVVMMVVGLLFAWGMIMGKYTNFEKRIGERQFDLINTYQIGEKALFYIDQSAKYAAFQTIYDLAQEGGCTEENLDECNPTIEFSKSSFLNIFPENLNNYLSTYDQVDLILDNYDLRFEGNTLIGLAKEPLKIPIREKNVNLKSAGTYSIKASFKVDLGNFDFSD